MSKRTSIRIPDDLYDQLSKRAKTDQRTVSNLIVFLLNQSINVATSVAATGKSSDTPHPNT